MELENCSRLEEKIRGFVDRYQKLKEEKERIEGELSTARGRIEKLSGEVEGFREGKVKVRERVEELIKNLEFLKGQE